MLGAGNICLSLIVAIACLPAIQARSGTWQSAATPYQYNAVNYSAMNLTKVEELELRIAQLENALGQTPYSTHHRHLKKDARKAERVHLEVVPRVIGAEPC